MDEVRDQADIPLAKRAKTAKAVVVLMMVECEGTVMSVWEVSSKVEG
jgi:hypothetical protein